VTSRALVVGVALLAAAPASAQTAMDTLGALSVTQEQERSTAEQSRSVTRSAIGAVFGAGQGAPTNSAPSAPQANSAPPAGAAAPPPSGAAAVEPERVSALPPNGIAAPPSDHIPIMEGAPHGAAAGAAAGEVPVNAANLSRGRDPFRPFTLSLRAETRENEVLTPLQRYELPQLRLAGIVLELSPPRAMLQDNAGMGYIITPGTPIGNRHGIVKAIEPRRVVVEEQIIDYYGREQTHQVVIEMAKEDKPLGQE
jgi:hypothetical protein